jgi:hypothetical protein
MDNGEPFHNFTRVSSFGPDFFLRSRTASRILQEEIFNSQPKLHIEQVWGPGRFVSFWLLDIAGQFCNTDPRKVEPGMVKEPGRCEI